MRVVQSPAAARVLGAMALVALLPLNGCAPEVRAQMQARAEAQGTARPIESFENANFGVRQQTPGYLYGQGSRNAGASQPPHGDGARSVT